VLPLISSPQPGLTHPGFFYRFHLGHLFQASLHICIFSCFHKGAVYEEAHNGADFGISIGAIIRLGTTVGQSIL